jgi:hypothetical protein
MWFFRHIQPGPKAIKTINPRFIRILKSFNENAFYNAGLAFISVYLTNGYILQAWHRSRLKKRAFYLKPAFVKPAKKTSVHICGEAEFL